MPGKCLGRFFVKEGMIMENSVEINDVTNSLIDVKDNLDFLEKASEYGYEHPDGFVDVFRLSIPKQISAIEDVILELEWI